MKWQILTVAIKRSEAAPRVRAGGVVVAKHRLIKAVKADPSDNLTTNRKLRIAGLPNRKAGQLARTRKAARLARRKAARIQTKKR